jgi:hypothetical protein
VKAYFGLALTWALSACQSGAEQLAECRLSSHHSTLTSAMTEADVIDRARALALEIQQTPLDENCCTAFTVNTRDGVLPEAMRSFEPALRTLQRAGEVGLTSYSIVRVVTTDRYGQQQTLWFHLDRCGNQIAL